VQGDEFDQVIFSVGYAKNTAGKFTANFGLLARKEGEHRLNVAITRARKRITVVTSLFGEDFKVQHLKNEGVKLLRSYINYVAQITEGRKIEIDPLPVQGFHTSWLLTDKISGETQGYQLSPNLLSKMYDLTLIKGEQYHGAILTDDQRLYGSNNVKATFVYHRELLKSKGWKTVQFYSRQYWLDDKKFVEEYLAHNRTEKDQA